MSKSEVLSDIQKWKNCIGFTAKDKVYYDTLCKLISSGVAEDYSNLNNKIEPLCVGGYEEELKVKITKYGENQCNFGKRGNLTFFNNLNFLLIKQLIKKYLIKMDKLTKKDKKKNVNAEAELMDIVEEDNIKKKS